MARDRSPRWGHVVVGGPHGVQGTVDDGVVVAVGGAVEGSGWRGVLWRVRGTFGLVNWGCCPGAYPPWASRWGAVNLTPGAGLSAYWVGPQTLRGPSSFSCIWTFGFGTRFSPARRSTRFLSVLSRNLYFKFFVACFVAFCDNETHVNKLLHRGE